MSQDKEGGQSFLESILINIQNAVTEFAQAQALMAKDIENMSKDLKKVEGDIEAKMNRLESKQNNHEDRLTQLELDKATRDGGKQVIKASGGQIRTWLSVIIGVVGALFGIFQLLNS